MTAVDAPGFRPKDAFALFYQKTARNSSILRKLYLECFFESAPTPEKCRNCDIFCFLFHTSLLNIWPARCYTLVKRTRNVFTMAERMKRPMAFHKLNTPSLKEVFVQEVENMILSGELKIGDKLPPERELVESTGVSLSVVTAGIAELESCGFVEIRPRQGIFVSDYVHKGSLETLVALMRYKNLQLNGREVRSLIETRIALEQLMVQQVIERSSDEGLRALAPYLDRMDAETEPQKAIDDILDFFHELSILSDNILLPLLYHSFREAMGGMYTRFLEHNGIAPIRQTARQLYDFVLARDKTAAVEWVDIYLRRVIEGGASIVSPTE